MKKLFLTIIVLASFSCKQTERTNLNVEKKASIKSNLEIKKKHIGRSKPDTIYKNSNCFKINNIMCFWKFTLVHYDSKGGIGTMELKKFKNNKTLLTFEDYYDMSFYDTFGNYIIDYDTFKDANFDNFKDYVIRSREQSGSAGDFYNVYLFETKSKTFKLSNKLSNYGFELDTINRTISNYYKEGLIYNISTTSYYNKNGKLKFVESTQREI